MAMIFLDKSTCAVCNGILHRDEDIYGFQHFVPNVKDKIYFLSDNGCHKNCIETHPYGKAALQLSEASYLARANKICWASGNIITTMEDYFALPLLTSDDDELLFQYNFLTLDKRNIPVWNQRRHFISIVDKFIKEDKWQDSDDRYRFWETSLKLLK